MTDPRTITATDLRALAVAALGHAGAQPAHAETTADILIDADLMGVDTHGVRRLVPYTAKLRGGAINPTPNVRVEDRGPVMALVDGDDGLGQVAALCALEAVLSRARASGLAFAAVRNGNHMGALAPYGRRAADAGMMLIIGTNASPAIAPWGARDLVVGNNPLAVAAPRPDGPPFIFDGAMTMAARGKMRKLRDAGQPMPLGWALDADGRPTTDPAAGLAGFIQFMGGHKGSGLALAGDVLAGVLSGGAFLTGVGDVMGSETPQRSSHYMLALDPDRLLGDGVFAQRMTAFAAIIKNATPIDPARPVMLPGEIEGLEREHRQADGIPVDAAVLADVERLAGGG